MLKERYLQHLQNKKNLLAFSGGADSTALFYLLLEYKISFDIAIVDYGLRKQSAQEVASAQNLAKKYNLHCYVHQAKNLEGNFEQSARLARYNFFQTLIEEHHYENLLTAHHLGDKLEWLLMQLSKGAGLSELLGMNDIETKEKHLLIRPLLSETKESLIAYLQEQKYTWFEDESNQDLSIKRNYFRHNISNLLLKDYASGIKKSFEYLSRDLEDLIQPLHFTRLEEMSYAKNCHHQRSNIIALDLEIKKRGFILSAAQRQRLSEESEIIVARSLLVCITPKYLFIAPFVEDTVMSKDFKERCRVLNIPSKLRPYLYSKAELFTQVELLFI